MVLATSRAFSSDDTIISRLRHRLKLHPEVFLHAYDDNDNDGRALLHLMMRMLLMIGAHCSPDDEEDADDDDYDDNDGRHSIP